jgi:hypothetical protein
MSPWLSSIAGDEVEAVVEGDRHAARGVAIVVVARQHLLQRRELEVAPERRQVLVELLGGQPRPERREVRTRGTDVVGIDDLRPRGERALRPPRERA